MSYIFCKSVLKKIIGIRAIFVEIPIFEFSACESALDYFLVSQFNSMLHFDFFKKSNME